ncbi:MAG: hypothetical protein M5U01_30920 [Ardenticatenaceae bacterium]|nr:hypothetical protein [Ardenticatenaceae bacterium]
MVGHLFNAIAGNIGDDNTEIGGRVDIDVLDPDGVADHQPAARQALQHSPRDRHP